MLAPIRLLAVGLVLAAVGVPLAACGDDASHVLDLSDAGRTTGSATTSDEPDAMPSTTVLVDAGVDAALSKDEEGEATYYDANGTGACGFKASTDFYVVAMNGTDYDKSICGSCIDVTGPKGSVVVRITDKCPGCGAGGLDLSITAFTKIADKSAGRVQVRWHYIDCP